MLALLLRHFKPLCRVLFVETLVLAVLYGALQFAPHRAFAYSFGEGRFVLHSDRPIADAERKALLEAARRIERCELDDPRVRHEVFLCHDPARFAFFAGMSHEARGVTTPFNVSFVKAGTGRSLAALIAHERTHALIVRRYGFFARWFIPKWKQEGVCEYVAGEISYDAKRGIAMLRADQSEDSGAFRYFTYWLAVNHLVGNEGLTLSQILATSHNEAVTLRAAIKSQAP